MKRARLVLMAALAAAFTMTAIACSDSSPLSTSPAAPAGVDGTAAKPVPDLPVTTVIHDTDAGGLAGDISSDGLGPYPNGVNGVRSVLLENGYNRLRHGDWEFESGSRRAGNSLDPEDAVQPGDPAYLVPATPPFWGTQVLSTKLSVKCTLLNVSMISMTAGSTITCPMLRRLTYDGWEYGLQTARSFTGWQETTDVQIVCNSTNSGGCANWTIEPIAQGRAIGRLMKAAAKQNQPNQHIGTFYVGFRITVTRP